MENYKEADEIWIVLGFIFALLGGVLGIAIGGNYIRGNYKKEVKIKGMIMVVIGIVMLLVIAAMK
jgi:uncharacterized membrane protein YsdA (DUF1294 family)